MHTVIRFYRVAQVSNSIVALEVLLAVTMNNCRCLLGRNAVQSGRSSATFSWNTLLAVCFLPSTCLA
jgi:hypothetical protein